MPVELVRRSLLAGVLLTVAVCLSAGLANGEGVYQCLQYNNTDGPCRCRLENDFTLGLDLSPLRSKFADPQLAYDNHVYVWGPCGNELAYGEMCSPESHSVACQGTPPSQPPSWYSLGQETSAVFSVNTSGDSIMSTVQYSGGSGERSSIFMLKCDENMNDTFEFVSEDVENKTYTFLITGRSCCLVSIPGPSSNPSSKLSVGSILLIILAVVIVLYLAGGVAYQRFVRGARGLEMIPHYDIWMSLVNYLTDGVTFIFSPCYKPSGERRSRMQYEKI